MKIKTLNVVTSKTGHFARIGSAVFCALLITFSAVLNLSAATVTIYSEDFDSYVGAATNLTDTSNAKPASPDITYNDDNPVGGVPGSGVQLIDWLSSSGPNSLLVRSGSEARVQLKNIRSGTGYQLDYWLYVVKPSPADRNFLLILRALGADSNLDDYLAYRSDRAVGPARFYWDGIGATNGWTDLGVPHIESTWQHHRVVFDPATRTFNLFIDDMGTPVLTNADLSRPDSAVPALFRIRHEGNSVDDGYFAIDDIMLTVEDSSDITNTFTEGFEGYAARTNATDNANPQTPWLTVESLGTASSSELDASKVQVVDSSVVAPHSGTNCLKLEGGVSAGASFAWGLSPQSDVQITWWARVPESVSGTVANYLRVSLYGQEDGIIGGDSALLGYGSRDATTGDATSLTIYSDGWLDTGIDYTPDVWKQYRLITHTSQGTYSILLNPEAGSPTVVVDRAALIGGAAAYGPMYMVAWSSSNGSGHPPVYIDDIEIKSVVSNPDPLGKPYTVQIEGTRFTNSTVIEFGGTVGGMAVDPNDNTTIVVARDVAGSGEIFVARKVASGNWQVDSDPLLSNVLHPSGLAIDYDGTLWWTEDFTASLKRLKAPWESNIVEEVISNFVGAGDDDPIDLTMTPANFSGFVGESNMLAIADRGSDGNAFNAIYMVDPATTNLNQTNYSTFIVGPTATGLGPDDMISITPLPQFGEVVTVGQDLFQGIAATDGDGLIRYITPTVFSPTGANSILAAAVDPTTSRVWLTDNDLSEVWSVDLNPTNQTADVKELSFPLTDITRPDKQIKFHDPGMAFATNGAFMVISDESTQNGGGRLVILHNEAFVIPAFSITNVAVVPAGVLLEWEPAGAVNYQVLRGTNVADLPSFQDISGNLSSPEFTDTNAPAGDAYYQVLALP